MNTKIHFDSKKVSLNCYLGKLSGLSTCYYETSVFESRRYFDQTALFESMGYLDVHDAQCIHLVTNFMRAQASIAVKFIVANNNVFDFL